MSDGTWVELTSVALECDITARIFTETNGSGLNVAVVDVPGPLVTGVFPLATEAFTDKGEPHTLEHLIFLGSEEYPYKGVLDQIANRCLARGTNAWTSSDHTAYTLNCVGAEGFLQMLPVYLDHILWPTITDAGVLTEVHHVNGSGEDGGVVYAEMQGRNNSSFDLGMLALFRLVYPETSGYYWETGGIMKDIRELTAEDIREYHRLHYRPDNLMITIAGAVAPEDVFAALETTRAKVMARKGEAADPATLRRSFSEDVAPMAESSSVDITFPDSEEESGMVMMGFQGSHYSQFADCAATEVLWRYLAESAVSPMEKELVQTADPYASEVWYYNFAHQRDLYLLCFEGVPLDDGKIDAIPDKVMEVMAAEAERGIDMSRMASEIAKTRNKHLAKLEDRPHMVVSTEIVRNFVHGTRGDYADLHQALSKTAYYDDLAEKDEAFWNALLRAHVVDAAVATVVARPSAAMSEELQAAVAERTQQRVDELGEAGLKALEDALEAAQAENDRDIPDEVIAAFPIPSTASIAFVPVVSLVDGEVVSAGGDEVPPADVVAAIRESFVPNNGNGSFPWHMQLSHVPSAFVQIDVVFDTAKLTPDQRLALPLVMELFWKPSSCIRGFASAARGMDREAIVKELTRDTLTTVANVGGGSRGSTFSPGSFSQLARLRVKATVDKYMDAVSWLADLMWQAENNAEDIKIAAQKIIGGVAEAKRDGTDCVAMGAAAQAFHPADANANALNAVRQHAFCSALVADLESGDESLVEGVINRVADVRMALFDMSSALVHVSGGLAGIQYGSMPWEMQFVGMARGNGEKVSPSTISRASSVGNGGVDENLFFGVGAVESGYLTAACHGLASFNDPNYVPLRVAISFLTAMEGPLWKLIRGPGLAYGSRLVCKCDEGMMYFVTYRATHVVEAFRAAANAIAAYGTGETLFDALQLEAAKSSLVCSLIEPQGTLSGAASVFFQTVSLKNLPPGHTRAMLAAIETVTADDLKRVTADCLAPLFTEGASITAVHNPSKAGEVAAGLAEMGFEVKETTVDEFFA